MRNASLLLGLFLFSLIVRANPVPVAGPRFIRNEGQWDAAIRYRAEVPGGVLLLYADRLHYMFYDTEALAARHAAPKSAPPTHNANLRLHGVDVVFEGAGSDVRLEASQPDDVPRHYFFGEKRAAHVRAYGEVWYRQIYRGVDLRLYAYQNTLKYEFVVAPGVDPSVVRLRYDGADGLRLDDGNLVVSHSLGEVKEYKPYCYQEKARRAVDVEGRFVQRGNRVQFAFGADYDPRVPLVIDPVLVFSTYSGSTADNWGHTATYDEQGNLYSGGSTFGGPGFPATTGAFQVESGGEWDVAILKFSPDGKRLLYATYLGGAATEVPHSLIVNPQGELVIFGTTSSRDFPTRAGAFDNSFGGGPRLTGGNEPVSGMDYVNGSDLFVVKLSADGRRLVASTFVGGSGNDGLNLNRSLAIQNYGDAYRGEVMTDSLGRVYLATVTQSANFPAAGGGQNQLRGSADAVLLRLSADLSRLEFSTLLGGQGYDAAYGLRVGRSGAVYACGVTTSAELLRNFSGTAAAFKPTLGGSEDGFVVRIDPPNGVTALTFLGTPQADVAELLDLDARENVYVLGVSSSGNYPVTPGTYRNARSGQFVQALNPTLTTGLFSTVVGSGRGVPDFVPTAFLVTECGELLLSGWGGSINATVGNALNDSSSTRGLPVTPDAFRPTTDGNNFYLMMLGSGATSLRYATFFGSTNRLAGDHVDGGTCRFDRRGIVYHAACSCNRDGSPSNFTTTPGAWSATNPSFNCNNAAFKFAIDPVQTSADTALCRGDVAQLAATGGVSYQWSPATGLSATNVPNPSLRAEKPATYTVKIITAAGCVLQRTIRVSVPTDTLAFSVTNLALSCREPARIQLQLTSGSADGYRWSMGNGDTLRALRPEPYTYARPGTYTVRLLGSKNGCPVSSEQPVTVGSPLDVPNVITPNGDGKNDVLDLGQRGLKLEIYNRWGKPVLQTDDYPNDWGPGTPVGTYYYLLTPPSGAKCKGWIEVMR